MNQPVKVLFVTIYPLWAEVCRQVLGNRPRRIDVTPLIADNGLTINLSTVLVIRPDVVLVSLDLPSEGLDAVRVLRAAGYRGHVMVVCSHYALPSVDELAEVRVEAVISSLAGLDELASSIYAVAAGRSDPLLLHQLPSTCALTHRTPSRLNEREREILQLVASDLTDREIAEHLRISVRTVSNHLHYIYSKLGVKGRVGAVIAALGQGLIKLHSWSWSYESREIE